MIGRGYSYTARAVVPLARPRRLVCCSAKIKHILGLASSHQRAWKRSSEQG